MRSIGQTGPRGPAALAAVVLALVVGIAAFPARAQYLRLGDVTLHSHLRLAETVVVARVAAASRENETQVYRLQTLTVLKGRIEPEPVVRWKPNPRVDYARPPSLLPRGRTALFFLTRKPDHWEPVFTLVRPGMIVRNSSLIRPGDDVERSLVTLLLASVRDPDARAASLHYLGEFLDARIVRAVLPFVGDPDPLARDAALSALAWNQYVPAIAWIAAHGQYEAVRYLAVYRDPRAVRLLNPLLRAPNDAVRLHAALGLKGLADRSSIPFLAGVLDDDHIHVVHAAYWTLWRLAGLPGPPKDLEALILNREATLEPLRAWLAERRRSSGAARDAVRAPQTDPSGWRLLQIGPPAEGTMKVEDGAITVSGNGDDVFFESDLFSFACPPQAAARPGGSNVAGAAASVSLRATVRSVSEGGKLASAGLMIRESAAPNAFHVNLRVTPGGDLVLAWRGPDAPASQFVPVGRATFPVRLRLDWDGRGEARAWREEQGRWVLLGSAPLVLSRPPLAGLAVFSGDRAHPAVARFSDVVQQTVEPTPANPRF